MGFGRGINPPPPHSLLAEGPLGGGGMWEGPYGGVGGLGGPT